MAPTTDTHCLLKMIEVIGRTPSQQARMAMVIIGRIAVQKKSDPMYSRVPVQMLLVDRGSPRDEATLFPPPKEQRLTCNKVTNNYYLDRINIHNCSYDYISQAHINFSCNSKCSSQSSDTVEVEQGEVHDMITPWGLLMRREIVRRLHSHW